MEQESWLSGALEEFSPILMPAAHALVQAERDVEKAVSNLATKELWMKLNGAPSVGFHMLHIAGSIDRLLTYARGENLNQEQFNFLSAETDSSQTANTAEVLQLTKQSFHAALETIKKTSDEILFEPRTVGRMKLPTNVFGLLFHIAEHTQRHTGQIIATAKIVRGVKSS
jgi:uncharacterized damage-inducible protein DinB